MSVKKYIIILLMLLLSANCAPPRNIRQKSSAGYHPPDSTNKTTFNWTAKEHESSFEESGFSDFKENNYYNIDQHDVNEDINNSPAETNSGNIRKKHNYESQKQADDTKSNRKKISTNNKNIPIKKYKVKKGDNLIQISKKFNISLNSLKTVNNIKNEDKIYKGMILKIPNGCFQNQPLPDVKENKERKMSFIWPIKKIYNTKQDGRDGVKPIGIIITGENGSAVFPSAEGIVSKIGDMRGYGSYIIIKHTNKYLTIYSNLRDINVCEGEKVRCGTSIGRVDGNKLHFQIGHSGKPENPLMYLSRKS